MDYRPKRKDFKAAMLSGFCMTAAVALFFLSSRFDSYRWVYQLTGLILAIVGVTVFLTNVQSDYIYKVDDRNINVYRVTGKNSLCVCSLSLEESLSEIVTAKQFKENKGDFPKNNLAVNYCKNIFPKEYSLYFFNFNGKVNRMKFEPDEIFTNYMNERIKLALANIENGDFDNE